MKRFLAVAAVMVAAVVVVLTAGSAYAGRTAGLRFHAASATWVSAQRGWLLGSAPCGQATCTTVIGTTDGGRTWSRLGTLDAPLSVEQDTGITQVRFADDLH